MVEVDEVDEADEVDEVVEVDEVDEVLLSDLIYLFLSVSICFIELGYQSNIWKHRKLYGGRMDWMGH